MANIRGFTDKEIQNDGINVDFDLQKVYSIPSIEVSGRETYWPRA